MNKTTKIIPIARLFSMVLVAMLATAALLSSCHGIYNDLEPCPHGIRLRFVYDYNMEFANAFHSQVDCVTLLVYDEQGRSVASYTETGDVLSDENYRMTIDLEKGNYHLVAYGGLACEKASFRMKSVPVVDANVKDLQVEMTQNGQASSANLHPLFHGMLDVDVHEDTYQESTVYLMKNTNNIRVILQQMNYQPVESDDFSFTITDDNTLFAADNSLIPNGTITYSPWAQGERKTGVTEEGETEVQVAYAELSTSRLTTGNHPRLVIKRNTDGEEVVNIPLNQYLLLLKSDRFSSMGSQEFLDRESDWSLIFFLDKNGEWIRTHIVINDWIVRINDAEM